MPISVKTFLGIGNILLSLYNPKFPFKQTTTEYRPSSPLNLSFRTAFLIQKSEETMEVPDKRWSGWSTMRPVLSSTTKISPPDSSTVAPERFSYKKFKIKEFFLTSYYLDPFENAALIEKQCWHVNVLTLACPVKLLALAIVVDNAPSVMHQILASLADNSIGVAWPKVSKFDILNPFYWVFIISSWFELIKWRAIAKRSMLIWRWRLATRIWRLCQIILLSVKCCWCDNYKFWGKH